MDRIKSSLREIFADAAEIVDPAARSAFLDSACKGDSVLRDRVERLLAADARAGNFLRQPNDTTEMEPISEKPGDRIGRYRLVERIGRGGGGVVYLAEQEEPVRRRVALKILKLGMDTQSVVARFEAERQALAMMDHPNIARVLDAGATETGRPFFVMEFVSGQRLSAYCEQHQLSLQQRLELFILVCRAVQHAHQKGIIHRDLKPSNILVTEQEGIAVPKVGFSPDGKWLATSTARGTEQFLEMRVVASGELAWPPLLHRDDVSSFDFSREGRWLVTGCEDHTACVWDTVTGKPVSPLLPHNHEVRQTIFSPDGARVVTLERRGAVRLWSVQTGEPITSPLLYPRNDGDGRVSYSPDGKRLLLARGGDEAWLRELQRETASLEELRLRAQVLPCTRFEPAAGMVPMDEPALNNAWKQLRALQTTPEGR